MPCLPVSPPTPTVVHRLYNNLLLSQFSLNFNPPTYISDQLPITTAISLPIHLHRRLKMLSVMLEELAKYWGKGDAGWAELFESREHSSQEPDGAPKTNTFSYTKHKKFIKIFPGYPFLLWRQEYTQLLEHLSGLSTNRYTRTVVLVGDGTSLYAHRSDFFSHYISTRGEFLHVLRSHKANLGRQAYYISAWNVDCAVRRRPASEGRTIASWIRQ